MEKLKLYRRRARQLYYIFLLSPNIILIACLPLYPYFKLPLHPNLSLFSLFFILGLGLISLPIAYLIKKKFFPVDTSSDHYWSYTATRGYFWVFTLCLLPFLFSLIFFVAIAQMRILLLGYSLSLCGLILLKPKEEDLK
ncbi:MAG: hypothetical protein N3D14_00515 [Aquificaceae bacterium]|nr:hypothetical protein [Aquificaceae bacterium]MCX8163860.1 hypothetical protein [Aquificaceae bacterium]